MKRASILIGAVMILTAQASLANAADIDYDNAPSVVLMTEAWEAFENKDFDQALFFTQKCIDLYGKRAQKMQTALTDFPKGRPDQIHGYWALNDVATAYYVQGEIYFQQGEQNKAQDAFRHLLNEYSFGQCWDPRGWFWRPADAAKDRLLAIKTGEVIDYGDYSSQMLLAKAWSALEERNFELVLKLAEKCIDLYRDKALEMENGLSAYPSGEKEEIFTYWALNDVATAYYIKALALINLGRPKEAQQAFGTLRDEFSYGQCWDPRGWFWKPAEAAEDWISRLSSY